MSDDVIGWLLEGDPSIRWQAERDLLSADGSRFGSTRALVAIEGWGKQLLDHQDPSGTWGGGLYVPKWTSTTYTLLLLRRLGLPPDTGAAIAGCRRLLEDAEWVDGGVSYWGRPLAERCVNGMVLSIASYLDLADERVAGIARLLLTAQMTDGGWNCRDHRGATHSSFHTTISALEGLDLWRSRHPDPTVDDAIDAGREFLLRHALFRSHTTGEVIDPTWLVPHFPPRWHYDVLRGLDHLATSGAPRDPRIHEAIDVVRAARRGDGRWAKGSQFTGRTFFTLEPGRVAGRWNTLRALRVLRWWEGAQATAEPPTMYGL